MPPLFAVTLLAGVSQVGIGLLLGLPAFQLARRRRWWLSALAAPATLILALHAGGLVLGVPCALVLTALYAIMAALQGRRRQWARVAQLTLGFLSAFWVLNQIELLRLRLAREPDSPRIAVQVTAIALGLAAGAAVLESLVRGRSGPVAARHPSLKLYGGVRVCRLDRPPESYDGWGANQRPPAVGDPGTLIDILEASGLPDRFVVESSSPDGITIWLADFSAEELEPFAH